MNKIDVGKCNELLTNQVIQYIKSKIPDINNKKLEKLRCKLKTCYKIEPENDSILIPILKEIKFSNIEIEKIEKIWVKAISKCLI